jgi:hypothetical protein
MIDGFPHPTIAQIIGIPTHKLIAKKLNLQLNANVSSVQSNLAWQPSLWQFTTQSAPLHSCTLFILELAFHFHPGGAHQVTPHGKGPTKFVLILESSPLQ